MGKIKTRRAGTNTRKRTDTHTHIYTAERDMNKMKSTGGLRKQIRNQTAEKSVGTLSAKTEYHDFPGKTLTPSETLTTEPQMKGKLGLTSTLVKRKSKLRKVKYNS